MVAQGFAVFETALGHCGVAWDERAVIGCQLPENSQQRTRARLAARFPSAQEQDPPGHARAAIEGVAALLRGERVDLTDVPLGMDGLPRFHRLVYELVRTVGPGDTVTYGEVATRLGYPGAARAVGQAMGSNPFAPIVPCHRVLAAGGRAGGFSATGGVKAKRRMLELEGVHLEEPTLFDL
ncbi:methylated-DNA-[protein]-cysteine S-methyltransferase [Saccharomonospora amisosensis]|uniref:methylated-DNA--[protein]-cysteine S-methyltransferase n=1 Tax=Saccharomonospora amisosensis TaxID=1128677 RepID=A0A7X5UTF2_9PSEU|nr:methylated-DNA--[protein]-cysteine S-methyltransferase [Saccharomonospora amisosensis]NIJ13878.1 methylated-DNA-[protein]-cysteine S-methyltransferase [Saccharomonospora amisosensis]